MEISQLTYFVIASALLTLAPGPDILYLIATSLASGVRRGTVLAAGLCSGLIFHTALVAGGVAAIIRDSEFLFHLLRFAGAAYLLYLSWISLREDAINLISSDPVVRQSSWRLFRRGLVMNLLNPKVILFFLAFLPQFVRSNASAIELQIIFLGGVFGAQAFCVFSIVAVLAGSIRNRILSKPNIAQKLGCVQALTLFCIGMALLFGQ